MLSISTTGACPQREDIALHITAAAALDRAPDFNPIIPSQIPSLPSSGFVKPPVTSTKDEKWSSDKFGGLVAEAEMKQIPGDVRWDEAFAKHADEASGKVDSISARARIAIEADCDDGEAPLTLDIMLKLPGSAE
jgi:hypothetical protein